MNDVQDPKRGTGRTTALMLAAISQALLNQGKWIDFVDHAEMGPRQNLAIRAALSFMFVRLGLKNMQIDTGGVRIRSFHFDKSAREGQ
ncbi:MAG TPA: hypothetical protein VGM98_00470 [Schlesneria sp.]